jgi:hypothetical protein
MEVTMPVQLFTEAERAQRDRFPEVITSEDLIIFFTLSARDHEVSVQLVKTRIMPPLEIPSRGQE